MKAIWNGKVIAESDDIVTVEGNAYFPAHSLRRDYVAASRHTSVCPWKGTAQDYDLEVDGLTNPNAVWFYPDPKPAAVAVRDRVAFGKAVQVTV